MAGLANLDKGVRDMLPVFSFRVIVICSVSVLSPLFYWQKMKRTWTDRPSGLNWG